MGTGPTTGVRMWPLQGSRARRGRKGWLGQLLWLKSATWFLRSVHHYMGRPRDWLRRAPRGHTERGHRPLAWPGWVHGGVSQLDSIRSTQAAPGDTEATVPGVTMAAPGQSGSPTHLRGCGTSGLLPARNRFTFPSQPPRGLPGGPNTPSGEPGVRGLGHRWRRRAGVCTRVTGCRVRVPVTARGLGCVQSVSTSLPASPGAQEARTELLRTPGEAGPGPVQPLDKWMMRSFEPGSQTLDDQPSTDEAGSPRVCSISRSQKRRPWGEAGASDATKRGFCKCRTGDSLGFSLWWRPPQTSHLGNKCAQRKGCLTLGLARVLLSQ